MNFTTTKGAGIGRASILIHGPAGVGKTTLAGTTGDPEHTLILSAEAGLMPLRDLDIKVKDVDSLTAMREAFRYLNAGDHPFTWVILDSISEIAERILLHEKATCVTKSGEANTLGAYGNTAAHVFGLVKAFRSLSLNVVFIAKQDRVQDDTGRMLFGPRFPGKQLSGGMAYEFDIVCAMHAERRGEDDVRWLQTQPDGRYEAKDRSGALAPQEQPNLAAMVAKINGGTQ